MWKVFGALDRDEPSEPLTGHINQFHKMGC
jgi:hypothetical protein